MDKISTLVLVAGFLPAVVTLGFFFLSQWKRKEHLRRSPIQGKFLRWPGYTLSKDVEKLNDEVNINMAALMFIPMAAMAMGFSSVLAGAKPHLVLIGCGGSALVACLVLGVRLYRGLPEIQRKNRGALGERVVGERLQELRADGFAVFHDFPADGFNLDHIVVGKKAIYAVETKYKGVRKKKAKEEEPHKMRYDGRQIQTDDWRGSEDVDQAARQAEWLAKWLESRVGKRLPVRAILTYPGWFVCSSVPEPVVWVLNDKQIEGRIRHWESKVGINLIDAKVRELARKRVADDCHDLEI